MRNCKRCNVELKPRQQIFCSIYCAVVWRNQNTMIDEKRAKISTSLKGKPNQYKGRSYSEQARRNMSIAHIGKSSSTKGIKTGKLAWNRGIPHSSETKNKLRKIALLLGHSPNVLNCGNGRPLSSSHQLLYNTLANFGWVVEYPISLGKRQAGWPTCYKVDLALINKKLAIEVDGKKHNLLEQRHIDQRRDEKFRELGWTIIRVSNEQAMTLSKKSVKDILRELFNV